VCVCVCIVLLCLLHVVRTTLYLVMTVHHTLDTDDFKARVRNSAFIGDQHKHHRMRSLPCLLFITANSRWPSAWWVRAKH